MKIIDAQVHLWSQTIIPPVSNHRQVQSFSAEELLAEMAEAGVDGALIHPPFSWDPTSNALSIEACEEISRPLRHHGPVSAGRSGQREADPRLAPAARHDGHALGDAYGDQPRQLQEGQFDWIWPAVEKAGLPVALLAGNFLDKFRWIAETPSEPHD